MCHFITATMSADGDVQQVARCAKQHRLRWEPLENPSILRQLHPGERYYFTTRHTCDCGTAIGSALRQTTLKPAAFALREVEKLRKQGWSEHRIERWQEERRSSYRRQQAKIASHQTDRSAEVQNWLDFWHAAAELRAARSLGLLLHWYHTGLGNENITLAARIPWSLATLAPQQLLEVEEDTLYVVRLY